MPSGLTSIRVALETVEEEHGKIRVHEAQLTPPTHRQRNERELVAGGDIKWKPVDRTAALVISKSPWWAHPPAPPKNDQKPTTRKETRAMDIKTTTHRHQAAGIEDIVTMKSNDEINAAVCAKASSKAEKTVDSSEELVRRCKDAREALEILASSFKVSWTEFMDTASSRLNELRMTRMSIDSETKQVMNAFRDVRAFFLDKEFETERARLKDFVDICERLQVLKRSGFLDSVADTMLRLSERTGIEENLPESWRKQ